AVDIRLLHLAEELAGVRRQRFDVAALPLGVDRVEGERRLPGSRQAGDDDERVARQHDVDVLQGVLARALADDRALVGDARGGARPRGGARRSQTLLNAHRASFGFLTSLLDEIGSPTTHTSSTF